MAEISARRAWLSRVLALAAGAAAGLAHPPFGILPGLLGYGLLLSRLDLEGDRRPLRSAFFRGWLAGVGYFAVGVFWIVEPFMVDAENQAWMAPFALVLMAGGLALFWGAASLIYRLIRPRGVQRVLVFAGVLSALEWLRGHVLTGFPWDLPGESWGAGGAISQMASVIGVYGLGWITIAIAAAPAVFLAVDSARAKAIAMVCAVVTLAGLYVFGADRLAHSAASSRAAPWVRIVQANIDQKVKWKPEHLQAIVETYVALTRREAKTRPAIVIWPEGALPAIIDELLASGSPYASQLRDALEPGQTLLMGANRVELGRDGAARYFNSLVALRREGDGLRVTGVYDKHRLVPFGEFMPLGDLASKVGFRSLVHMPDDFTAGGDPRPMSPWGVPALQPLICYEALFPGMTREAQSRDGLRPAWILNVSNDSWFGVASGPLQHLNIASYRAIEEGLPIVRSTPTGVSAVIDAYGRVTPGARIGLGGMGVIDAPLPPALGRTPYSRGGDIYFAAMLLLSATLAKRFRLP